VMARLRPVIGDRDPNLLGSTFRSRGTRTFYQVRIGEDTRAAADELCGRIRRAGQACLVLRNINVRAGALSIPSATDRAAAPNRG
jgi:hypothetical protein